MDNYPNFEKFDLQKKTETFATDHTEMNTPDTPRKGNPFAKVSPSGSLYVDSAWFKSEDFKNRIEKAMNSQLVKDLKKYGRVKVNEFGGKI